MARRGRGGRGRSHSSNSRSPSGRRSSPRRRNSRRSPSGRPRSPSRFLSGTNSTPVGPPPQRASRSRSRRSPSRGPRRRRRRSPSRRRSRSRSPPGRPSRRSPSAPRGRFRSRSASPPDRRPIVEREKGGVKLFVGRLPRDGQVSQKMLRDCFEEFGEVLEVFVIDSQAVSNVGCAFIRMGTLEQAEMCITELHEQRVLIPEQRELGPMQVAFAKGEAVRLGLNEKEEILPSFKEARMKVVEHQEKRMFFEAMQKQQEAQVNAARQQHQIQAQAANAGMLPTQDLISLIKDGQRFGGPAFKQKWWSYCDQGWAGIYDYDPSHHPHETLAQFVTLAAFEHAQEPWFRSRFASLPPVQDSPGMPALGPAAGGPPGGMPPFGPPGMGPPGMGPPGMGPPPFAPPGMGPPPFGPPGGPMGAPPFGPPGGGAAHSGGPGSDSRNRDSSRGNDKDSGSTQVPSVGPGGRKMQDYTDVDNLSQASEDSDAGAIEDINADDI